MEQIKEFTIDFPTWYQGHTGGESKLLRSSDGQRCCLGFYCGAVGYTEEEILNVLTPSSLGHIDPQIDWLVYYYGEDKKDDRGVSNRLMVLNDKTYEDYVKDRGYNAPPLDYYTWLLRKMSKIAEIFAEEDTTVYFDGIA